MGESSIGYITFISPELYLKFINKGDMIDFYEGNKKIGLAEITEIYNDMKEYNIPLNFDTGKYTFKELSADGQNGFNFSLDEYGVLTYSKYETEVRLYDITEETVKECFLPFMTITDNWNVSVWNGIKK